MSSLYPELLEEQRVADWIDEHGEELELAGGILPPEILGLIDAAGTAFDAKVERLVQMIANLEAMAAAGQAEADRVRTLAASRKNRAATIKKNILHAMRETGRSRIEEALCDVRRARSAPSYKYTGPSKVPDRYVKISYAYDAAKAKALWNHLAPDEPGTVQVPGEPIEIVRGEHLRIS